MIQKKKKKKKKDKVVRVTITASPMSMGPTVHQAQKPAEDQILDRRHATRSIINR
jgi:hypothetical protein